MDIKSIISKNICSLRKREKLTQSEFAEQIGYSDKAVSKWERGESLPDAEVLYKIALFFNVSIEYLFENHEYSGLTNEELKKLEKREKIFKVSVAISIFFILISVTAVLLSVFAEYLNVNNSFAISLLVLSGTILLIVTIEYSLKIYKFLTTLLSIAIWTGTFGLYYIFAQYQIFYLIVIACILQIGILLLPKLYNSFLYDFKNDYEQRINKKIIKKDKENNENNKNS